MERRDSIDTQMYAPLECSYGDSDDSIERVEKKIKNLLNRVKGSKQKKNLFQNTDIEYPKLRKSMVNRAFQSVVCSTPFMKPTNHFINDKSLNISPINSFPVHVHSEHDNVKRDTPIMNIACEGETSSNNLNEKETMSVTKPESNKQKLSKKTISVEESLSTRKRMDLSVEQKKGIIQTSRHKAAENVKYEDKEESGDKSRKRYITRSRRKEILRDNIETFRESNDIRACETSNKSVDNNDKKEETKRKNQTQSSKAKDSTKSGKDNCTVISRSNIVNSQNERCLQEDALCNKSLKKGSISTYHTRSKYVSNDKRTTRDESTEKIENNCFVDNEKQEEQILGINTVLDKSIKKDNTKLTIQSRSPKLTNNTLHLSEDNSVEKMYTSDRKHNSKRRYQKSQISVVTKKLESVHRDSSTNLNNTQLSLRNSLTDTVTNRDQGSFNEFHEDGPFSKSYQKIQKENNDPDSANKIVRQRRLDSIIQNLSKKMSPGKSNISTTSKQISQPLGYSTNIERNKRSFISRSLRNSQPRYEDSDSDEDSLDSNRNSKLIRNNHRNVSIQSRISRYEPDQFSKILTNKEVQTTQNIKEPARLENPESDEVLVDFGRNSNLIPNFSIPSKISTHLSGQAVRNTTCKEIQTTQSSTSDSPRSNQDSVILDNIDDRLFRTPINDYNLLSFSSSDDNLDNILANSRQEEPWRLNDEVATKILPRRSSIKLNFIKSARKLNEEKSEEQRRRKKDDEIVFAPDENEHSSEIIETAFNDTGKNPRYIKKRLNYIEENSRHVEEMSSEAEENLSNVEENPSDVEENPSDVEENPNVVDQNPSNIEENPVYVVKNSSEVEKNPSDVEENPKTIDKNSSAFACYLKHSTQQQIDDIEDDFFLREQNVVNQSQKPYRSTIYEGTRRPLTFSDLEKERSKERSTKTEHVRVKKSDIMHFKVMRSFVEDTNKKDCECSHKRQSQSSHQTDTPPKARCSLSRVLDKTNSSVHNSNSQISHNHTDMIRLTPTTARMSKVKQSKNSQLSTKNMQELFKPTEINQNLNCEEHNQTGLSGHCQESLSQQEQSVETTKASNKRSGKRSYVSHENSEFVDRIPKDQQLEECAERTVTKNVTTVNSGVFDEISSENKTENDRKIFKRPVGRPKKSIKSVSVDGDCSEFMNYENITENDRKISKGSVGRTKKTVKNVSVDGDSSEFMNYGIRRSSRERRPPRSLIPQGFLRVSNKRDFKSYEGEKKQNYSLLIDILDETQLPKVERYSRFPSSNSQSRKLCKKSGRSSIRKRGGSTIQTLSPVQESVENEVKVQIHSPPKIPKKNISIDEKQLRVVITPLLTNITSKKNQMDNKKPVRRNLEIELQTPSTSQTSFPLNNHIVHHLDDIGIDDKSFSGKVISKDSGTGTMMDDTHSRSFRTPGKIVKKRCSTNKKTAKRVSKVISKQTRNSTRSSSPLNQENQSQNKGLITSGGNQKKRNFLVQKKTHESDVVNLLCNEELVNVRK